MNKCFCAKCGKQLDLGDKFCRYCGSNMIKTADDNTPKSPFEIKDRILYKCNLKLPNYMEELFFQSKISNTPFYYLLSQIEDNPKQFRERVIDAYNNFKTNSILNIPSNVMGICHFEKKYNGIFEGLYFYEANLPKEVKLENYVFSKCYIHKFTAPKNCNHFISASFGELKINSFYDYKRPILLTNCFIGKISVPSAVKRIILGEVLEKHKAGDLVLSNCTIDELTINSSLTELLDWQKESIYTKTRIKTLIYPGYKEDIYKNNAVHYAEKIICKDGIISLRHINGRHVLDRGDEYPSDTKTINIKLFATNFALNNNCHIIYYSGKYSGYIFLNAISGKEISFTIPDSITILKIRKNKNNWVEIKKQYSNEWRIDVSNLDSREYSIDLYDPFNIYN